MCNGFKAPEPGARAVVRADAPAESQGRKMRSGKCIAFGLQQNANSFSGLHAAMAEVSEDG